MDKEELKRRRAALKSRSAALWKDIDEHHEEEKRVVNVLHNAESILSRLDDAFEQRTSLSKTDVSILMLATVLQVVRIHLLPKFQEKYLDENRLDHNDDIIKDMEREEIEEYKKKHKDWVSKKESVNRTVSSYNKSSLTQFFNYGQFRNRLQESSPAAA